MHRLVQLLSETIQLSETTYVGTLPLRYLLCTDRDLTWDKEVSDNFAVVSDFAVVLFLDKENPVFSRYCA